jgi:vitamin B12 transporter
MIGKLGAGTLLSVVALGAAPAQGVGQSVWTAADAELSACVEAVASGRDDAGAVTARAEAEYRRVLAARPREVEPRVLLARVLAQCKRPGAGFMAQGRLIGEANQLLEEALSIDGTHWAARFTLAMNHFHAPEFLGRTGDAIREFERLADQQGDRTEVATFADTYLYLGDLYLRRKRVAEAVSVWRRGAELFPRHTGLRERLQAHGSAAADERGLHPDAPAVAPAYSLPGVVVAASGSRMDDPRSGVALRRLDVLTTPGGAADLLHALRTGPGTTGAAEGSDLYVRGGDPAEAPVWVDGARIFYPGRHETLNGAVFGILDPAVMASAFFSSGGFSARYGNALSGVLDVRTDDRPAVRTAQVALNSVQGGATFQLPLGEGTGAWGAVRATDATAMLAMHGRGDDFRSAPRALEGIAGAAWEPRRGALLKVTGLVDGDRAARELDAYGYRGAFESRGANRLIGLSGRAIGGGGRTLLRASGSASSRTSGFAFGVLDHERTDRGLSARVDGDAELAGGRRLRAGLEASVLEARYGGSFPLTDRLAPGSPAERRDGEETTSQLGGYVEAEAEPLPRLALVAGVRADRLPGEREWTADPRLAVGLRATDQWTLRVGGGVFHQGRWRTRYTLPGALTASGVPRRAAHLVAGAERQGEPALKVEAYLKEYGDYVPSGDGPPVAAGRARGADAIVRWSRQERLNGWLTYSLLRGRVELEDGRHVPSAVDVTHTGTAVGTLQLPEGWQLGSTARYATGRPFTHPGGAVHGERLPDYRRLDARLTRFQALRAGTLVTYLELLNALDRPNVTAYTFDLSGERQAIPAFFRRTAVLGFSYSF